MNIFQRCIKGIIACPFRSFSIAAFVAVFTIVSMIGFYISQINESYEDSFAKEFGTEIWLDANGKDASEELLDRIRNDEGVLGVNGSAAIAAVAVDFQIPTKDAGDSTDGDYSFVNEVQLLGNTNTALTKYFREDGYALIEGVFPEPLSDDALIEVSVAQHNKLCLGDTIAVENGEALGELTISGIYEKPTSMTLSDTDVFCDYSMLGRFEDIYQHRISYTIYLDGKESIHRVLSIIEDDIGDDESYSWIDSISNSSLGFSGVHPAIASTTDLLVNVTYITALLVLILMTYLWMRKHYYEAGIYIALGQKRSIILLEFALEIIIISLCCIALFSFIGYVLINSLGRNIVLGFAEFSKSDYIQQEIDTSILNQSFQITAAVKSGCMILLVVLASTLLSGISILKYKATKLFTVEE